MSSCEYTNNMRQVNTIFESLGIFKMNLDMVDREKLDRFSGLFRGKKPKVKRAEVTDILCTVQISPNKTYSDGDNEFKYMIKDDGTGYGQFLYFGEVIHFESNNDGVIRKFSTNSYDYDFEKVKSTTMGETALSSQLMCISLLTSKLHKHPELMKDAKSEFDEDTSDKKNKVQVNTSVSNGSSNSMFDQRGQTVGNQTNLGKKSRFDQRGQTVGNK